MKWQYFSQIKSDFHETFSKTSYAKIAWFAKDHQPGGRRPLARGPKGLPRWPKATSQGQISSSISLWGGDSVSLISPSNILESNIMNASKFVFNAYSVHSVHIDTRWCQRHGITPSQTNRTTYLPLAGGLRPPGGALWTPLQVAFSHLMWPFRPPGWWPLAKQAILAY